MLLLCGFLFASPAAAQQEEPGDDTKPITFRVVIDAPRAYREMLERGLDIVRWQRDTRVTMPLLERLVGEARDAAVQALAADGYFSADVNTRIEHGADEAVVHIDVRTRQRTTIGKVDLRFQGPVLDDDVGRKRIRIVNERWSLTPGEPFRQQDWDSAKAGALGQLARGRYAAAAVVESEARVDPEHTRADLTLIMDSGPVFHADGVRVTGLKRYPASIVENLYPVRPGQAYDAIALDLFQRRLLETGYFNAVNLSIDPDPAKAAAAPLNVNVIEAASQRIETGIEFSTDTRVGVTLDYGNVDVFDSHHRFRSALNVNQKEQRVTVTLDTPPRPGGTWDTSGTQLKRTDIQGQVTEEAVVSYARNSGLESTPSQLGISAHFEQQSVAGSTTENNYAVFAQLRRTFRTTDDLVAPRRGVLGTFEIGTSIPGLASRDFVRAHARLNWLIPLGRRNDILVKAETGVVISKSRFGIPSSFLFRTGGDQTVRGYAFESIGVAQGEAIVGGRYLALASVEYTRWITDTLGGATFVDVGDAVDKPGAFDPAIGYGVGVRWRSPIGPVRADLAYGQRDRNVRLHFSVGYSF